MRINTRVVSDILTGEILERRSFEHFGKIARAMGVRLPSVFSNAVIGPLPADSTETVICVTPPINEPIDNAQVILFWGVVMAAGASVTANQFRIRRGTTTTGTSIFNNPWFSTTTAAANLISSGAYADNPGVVAGQQYCLTVTQANATGAGAIGDVCLMAMVL